MKYYNCWNLKVGKKSFPKNFVKLNFISANSTCNCPCIGCNPKTGLCPPNCKFAVWADWSSWSQCSTSCGGGKRNRDRLCKESLFPPSNAQWTQRTIDSYGSVSLSPWSYGRSIEARRVLDPKYCKRGEPTQMGTCNKHPCPGKYSDPNLSSPFFIN